MLKPVTPIENSAGSKGSRIKAQGLKNFAFCVLNFELNGGIGGAIEIECDIIADDFDFGPEAH